MRTDRGTGSVGNDSGNNSLNCTVARPETSDVARTDRDGTTSVRHAQRVDSLNHTADVAGSVAMARAA